MVDLKYSAKERGMSCDNCPRLCNCQRDGGSLGFCQMPADIYVSKHMLHPFEEPCVSGKRGAGTIFFTGCNLKCVFCQNKEISRQNNGKRVTEDELLDIIYSLYDMGAECIELVTPTHYTNELIPIIREAKKKVNIPFVWNSGGYDGTDTIRKLDGLIDVYMPDLKYFSDELARKYSNAPNYFSVSSDSIVEMLRQVGKPKFDSYGKLISGVIVRHLVLPACREDSVNLLSELSKRISPDDVILSLMSQYTPEFYDIELGGHKNLLRRLTSFEYSRVLDAAINLGFDGYFQGRESASSRYTPSFGDENKSFN